MKGNIALDITLFGVCLFVLGIFFLYIYTPVHNINQDIIASNVTGTQGTAILQNNDAQFPNIYDTAGMLFFLGVWIFLLFSSYFIDTHPIFFVLSLFLMIFCFIVIVNIGYAFQIISSDSYLTSVNVLFPKLVFINNHLFETMILVFFTCAIAMFAKKDRGAGGIGL